MRVIVTGGAGFIGSHIVDTLLQQGHEPHVLDDLSSGDRANLPDGVPLHVVDVRNAEQVRALFTQIRPQWVSHQAAQMSVSRSVREPRFDADVNIMGLVTVLEASAHVGVERFVFASSGGVLYGDVTEPAPEETPANPISPYGISKWAGERYLQFFSAEFPMRCTALRYSNVYGPRQNPHGEAGVVAIFCTKLLRGEAPTINGDGRYDRDYVFVQDVARANVAALNRTSGDAFRAFNVGSAIKTDVNQLAQALLPCCQAELARRNLATIVPAPLHGPARAGDLRSNVISFARAERELNWSPTIAVPAGLGQTATWFADKLLG